MIVSDNLYSSVHGFITPDFVTQLGRFVGESTERTTRGVKSVFSAILIGLVNKGTTPDGAKKLIELTETQGADPDEAVHFDEGQLARGNAAMQGIFGNSVGPMISRIHESTGLRPSSITKMLGIATPLIVGVVGAKIRQESMSPTTLATFLSNQRRALVSNLPGQLVGLQATARRNWKLTATVIVLVALLALWIFAKISGRGIESTADELRPIPQRMEQMVSLARLTPLAKLDAFLEDGDYAELPKRFSFSGLRFVDGTAELIGGAEKELNLLAKVLLKHPYARIRLEGFTDNRWAPLRMQQISDERALVIKDQLVGRGVEESQLETAGLGAADRLASNGNAQGRAKNNRIEIVVLEK